jgi:hypothetical protein
MFRRGLLVEPRPLHKDWEKTRFRSLTFHYSFGHHWSYRSNFDVIPVGLETRLPYLSKVIWNEREPSILSWALAAARQNAKTTNLSYLISWAIKLYLF